MNRASSNFLFMITVVSTLFVAGCASIGPHGIEMSRTDFNKAIQRTDGEQLLLNIVRQRYNDPVMFLEVASISSSMSRSGNLNLSSFLSSNLTAQSFTSGLSGNASESPLVFYSPNTGERFVRQILTPIDLRTISLLLQSGWSIERVLLVAGDAINGIRNTAAKDTPYAALVDNLRTLQRSERLSFALERNDNVDTLAIIPTPQSVNERPYREICRILGIQPDGRPIRIQLGVGDSAAPSRYVMLATRSLYSSFYFLSNGVNPPQADLAAKLVSGRSISGGLFDPTVSDLFRVNNSRGEPARAAVKVQYRGDWFYIDETDSDSQTTFALVNMMLMLQSGDTSRMAPLISLSPTR